MCIGRYTTIFTSALRLRWCPPSRGLPTTCSISTSARSWISSSDLSYRLSFASSDLPPTSLRPPFQPPCDLPSTLLRPPSDLLSNLPPISSYLLRSPSTPLDLAPTFRGRLRVRRQGVAACQLHTQSVDTAAIALRTRRTLQGRSLPDSMHAPPATRPPSPPLLVHDGASVLIMLASDFQKRSSSLCAIKKS